jgi:hypothetical protein
MTLINCISGTIYSRGFPARDKIQLYGAAFIFLILLYNSPAGLVLYWTLNNIFSLVKNCLLKIKNRKKIIFSVAFFCVFGIDLYLIFFHSGKPIMRCFIGIIFTGILFIPFLLKMPGIIIRRTGIAGSLYNTAFPKKCFIFSSVILFLLMGIVIPSSLIASSVREFSFIESYSSPFPFIFNTGLQAAALFLFWPLCIFFLFPPRVQFRLHIFMVFLCIFSVINTFLVPEKFGFLTTTLMFSEPSQYPAYNKMVLWNVILLIIATIILFFIFIFRKRNILLSFQYIVTISFIAFGTVNIYSIQKNYLVYQDERLQEDISGSIQPIYKFSRSGRNTVLILVDAAISSYVPHIFEEKQELFSQFSGFTWYPNCVSFANHTMVGALPIYGGYEYTPAEINKRDSDSLLNKQTEAYLLLPRLFNDAFYAVTVTDPPFDNYLQTNLGIFQDYPQIHAENLFGKYTSQWLQKHPGVTGLSISTILKRNLIYFSFFKTAPLFLRMSIYNKGDWLSTNDSNIHGGLTMDTINYYAVFDLLPELTEVDNNETGTFISIYELLTHYPAFLQAPDYFPAPEVTNFGSGPFAFDEYYHVNIASFMMLGKWFSFLKKNDVYDNTRIIIVSDHGRHGRSELLNNIVLPNGDRLQSFNPLLMCKDFNAGNGELLVDNSFMTNGDTPLLATNSIINNPINPFTHIPLQSNKENGVTITTIGALSSRVHSKYQYKINEHEWLHVHDNIFDPTNWEAVPNP